MQHLRQGTTLQGGKYQIEHMLGQGGFGITYLAEQNQLKMKVAIKEFFIHDLCIRDDTANVRTLTQADMVDRYRKKFFKEAQMIARFNHPGIVRVTDIFEENSTVYYVMDYLEGESLADIIKENGPLSERTAVRYIKKVAEALDYIHQSNVNHLDIKPANIMIRRSDDEPIIIDFGVSKQYDEQKDQATTTPPGVSNGYSPLEQYEPGGVSTFSPQSDIYALGATLYKLLTGNTPPKASYLLNEGLPPLPSHISPQVCKAIEWAMQPRRNDRPASVKELMRMMSAAGPEETLFVAPREKERDSRGGVDDVATPYDDDGKKRRVLIAVIVALLLIIVTGGYYMLKTNEPMDNADSKQTTSNVNPPEAADGSNPAGAQESPTTDNDAIQPSAEIEDVSTSADVSEEAADTPLPPKSHINLEGSFYNQKGSWPVKFDIQVNNGKISGTYRNVSQNVSMKVVGRMYDDGSMEIHDNNSILSVNLHKTDRNVYEGQATSGTTTLQVRLAE